MDTTIRSRLLAISIAVAALVASSALALSGALASSGEASTPVGSQIRVFGGDPEHVELVRWAAERFDATDLGVPAVDVHFHPDTSECYGHLGSELGGRVDVCVVLVSEIARDTLLHEMGHAWIDQHVTLSVRERFMEQRRLRSWHEAGVEWDAQAYEHGAEIIAWGLGTRYLAPTIPDRDPVRLAEGFELLTGTAVPRPFDA